MGFVAKTESGREVYVTEIAGKYVEDAYAYDGHYEDTGATASDTDLDFINENYQDSLYEAWMENQITTADFNLED